MVLSIIWYISLFPILFLKRFLTITNKIDIPIINFFFFVNVNGYSYIIIYFIS